MSFSKDDFLLWASIQEVVYKSETVQGSRPGHIDRLVFRACLDGKFKVSLGYKEMYVGDDFDEAAKVFSGLSAKSP